MALKFLSVLNLEKVVTKQTAHPEVTLSKFNQELAAFHLIEAEWRKRGIILMKSEFPTAEFIFIVPNLRPLTVAFAVKIDFTNYDVEPASVKFIDPLNGTPILLKDLPVRFYQPGEIVQAPMQMPGLPPLQMQQPPRLVLMGADQDEPFICIPGVREYHNHPAHTGDSWLLHRGGGEGTLAFLLDQLYNLSIPFVRSFNVSFSVGLNQIPQ